MPDEVMTNSRLKKAFVQNAVLEKARLRNKRLTFRRVARKEDEHASLKIKNIGLRVGFHLKPGEFELATYIKDEWIHHKIPLTDWANPEFDPDVIVDKVCAVTDAIMSSIEAIDLRLREILK